MKNSVKTTTNHFVVIIEIFFVWSMLARGKYVADASAASLKRYLKRTKHDNWFPNRRSFILRAESYAFLPGGKTPVIADLRNNIRRSGTVRCQPSAMATTVSNMIRGGSQSFTSNAAQQEEDKDISGITEEEEYITDAYHRAYIAVGSNVGNCFQNLMSGVSLLEETNHTNDATITNNNNGDIDEPPLIRIVRTSFLYETLPMYVEDQPSFLNGVVEIETKLSPHALLTRLKEVESQLGRNLNSGLRYGPRPIDLDVIYYGLNYTESHNEESHQQHQGGEIIETSRLCVPHPRMAEREFVLVPLCNLDESVIHPLTKLSTRDMLDSLQSQQSAADNNNKVDTTNPVAAVHVLPLPRGRTLRLDETKIMGILNVTPDSFSDGGKYKGSNDTALRQALQMIQDGADIIDIGGESTRPGAKEVETEIEMERTLPVIRAIREVSDIPISIDTRHAAVAKAAIEAGADIVNDVSGGTFDPQMLATVAQLQVPMVLMHMRGTPETMQTMTNYEDVVSEVSASLVERSLAAERAGIPRWLQVLDPGIGFAKNMDQNLSLLKHSNEMRTLVGDCPLLLGPSRKGFIGKITGETIAENRDFGTAAACLMGCMTRDQTTAPTILRVHNVKGVKQAVMIMNAILKAK